MIEYRVLEVISPNSDLEVGDSLRMAVANENRDAEDCTGLEPEVGTIEVHFISPDVSSYDDISPDVDVDAITLIRLGIDRGALNAFVPIMWRGQPFESFDGADAAAFIDDLSAVLAQPDAVPVTEPTNEPSSPSTELVVEQRPPTEAERNRLDDDGEGGLLDCDNGGAGTWDWDEIGPDDLTDRVSSDALLDAIAETDDLLPESGWTELTFSEGDSTFVNSIQDDDWRAIVTVGGDPSIGVWRQFDFYACVPDGEV
ncbi:hypothetical protein [Ilumatobacter sp.]